jgi:hypothetical protein
MSIIELAKTKMSIIRPVLMGGDFTGTSSFVIFDVPPKLFLNIN